MKAVEPLQNPLRGCEKSSHDGILHSTLRLVPAAGPNDPRECASLDGLPEVDSSLPAFSHPNNEPRSFYDLRVPLWVVMAIIPVIALVIVGVLAVYFSYERSLTTINAISNNYRSLACTVVENEIVRLMSSLTSTVEHLAAYVATSDISPADPTPMEVRKAMYYDLLQNPWATSVYLGIDTGECVSLDRGATPSDPPIYGISNNVTRCVGGYCSAYWTYTGWDDANWNAAEASLEHDDSPYNATERGWYMTAAASASVVYPPAYASMLPNGYALSQPVSLAVRRSNNPTHVISVVAAEIRLNRLDTFIQAIMKELVAKTIVFVVEKTSGYLIASSIEGEHIIVSNDLTSGEAMRVLATDAKDPTLRQIALAVVKDPSGRGWYRVEDSDGGSFSDGNYFINLHPVTAEGYEWIVVVGTNKAEWMSRVNSGIVLVVGIVVACIVGCCLFVGVVSRLVTLPLRRVILDVASLSKMDVDAVAPHAASRVSEVAILTDSINALTAYMREYRKFLPEPLFTGDQEEGEDGNPEDPSSGHAVVVEVDGVGSLNPHHPARRSGSGLALKEPAAFGGLEKGGGGGGKRAWVGVGFAHQENIMNTSGSSGKEATGEEEALPKIATTSDGASISQFPSYVPSVPSTTMGGASAEYAANRAESSSNMVTSLSDSTRTGSVPRIGSQRRQHHPHKSSPTQQSPTPPHGLNSSIKVQSTTSMNTGGSNTSAPDLMAASMMVPAAQNVGRVATVVCIDMMAFENAVFTLAYEQVLPFVLPLTPTPGRPLYTKTFVKVKGRHRRYLGLVHETVQKHMGLMDKVFGDRVFAVWNAHKRCARAELHAVQCAMEIVARFELEASAYGALDPTRLFGSFPGSVAGPLRGHPHPGAPGPSTFLSKEPSLTGPTGNIGHASASPAPPKLRIGIASSAVRCGVLGSHSFRFYGVLGPAVGQAVVLQKMVCKLLKVPILVTVEVVKQVDFQILCMPAIVVKFPYENGVTPCYIPIREFNAAGNDEWMYQGGVYDWV